MPNALKDVNLNFVSLVDNPAGIKAEVVLYKAEHEYEEDEEGNDDELCKKCGLGKDKHKKVRKEGRKISTKRLKALQEARSALHTALSDIIDTDGESSDDDGKTTKKRDTGEPMAKPELKSKLSDEDRALLDKFVADTEAKIDELEKQLSEIDSDVDDETEDDLTELTKSADPKVAMLAKRLADAEAGLSEATTIAKMERDTRLTAEYVSKVDTTMKGLPLGGSKLGPIMKRASEKLSKEDYDELEGLLKATATLIRDSRAIGKQHGSDLGDEGDAEHDEFESLIHKSMADAETAGQKLSYGQAASRVAIDRPDLWTKHRQSSSRRGGDD